MSEVEQEIAEQMGEEEDSSATDDGLLEEEQEQGGGVEEAAASPPPPRSQSDIDALTKKLENEAARHAKRVEEIMGDDFALLVPSPIDWTPGFIFNVPEMHPFPEQLAQLDAILGRGGEEDLLDAEDAEACDKCNARGVTKTGSRVEGQRTKPCGKCNGNGWVTKFVPMAPPTPLPTYQNGAAGQPVSPDTFQVKDQWGRPNGHPHFGLDPITVGT